MIVFFFTPHHTPLNTNISEILTLISSDSPDKSVFPETLSQCLPQAPTAATHSPPSSTSSSPSLSRKQTARKYPGQKATQSLTHPQRTPQPQPQPQPQPAGKTLPEKSSAPSGTSTPNQASLASPPSPYRPKSQPAPLPTHREPQPNGKLLPEDPCASAPHPSKKPRNAASAPAGGPGRGSAVAARSPLFQNTDIADEAASTHSPLIDSPIMSIVLRVKGLLPVGSQRVRLLAWLNRLENVRHLPILAELDDSEILEYCEESGANF